MDHRAPGDQRDIVALAHHLGPVQRQRDAIVDDILRSGRAIQETFDLCKAIGTEVIGCGVIAKFEDAPNEFNGIPVKSLLSFDVNFYQTEDEWKNSRSASEAEEEKVRF